MHAHFHTSRSFSLIELLIVIAIIGILAGAIIFTLGDPTTEARGAVVASELAGIPKLAAAHSLRNPAVGFTDTCTGFAGGSGPLSVLGGKYFDDKGAGASYAAWCKSDADDWAVAIVRHGVYTPATGTSANPVVVDAWCIDSTNQNIVKGKVDFIVGPRAGVHIATATIKQSGGVIVCKDLNPNTTVRLSP